MNSCGRGTRRRAPTRAAAARLMLLLALAATCGRALASAETSNAASCQGASAPAPLVEARAGLERDPTVLEARLKLADILLAQSCYEEAVHILEQGAALEPHNAALESRLRNARSMLSEQGYFDGLGRAEEAAKVQRNLLRCTKLSDVSACNEALSSQPDNASLLAAKADALLQANRATEALPIYRRAAELQPANDAIKAKLAAAEAQRRATASRCLSTSGTAALEACQLALLPGADDEFAIYQRKAILLQGIDQPEKALDSYIAASLLRDDDQSVALAIVALTDNGARKDALALAARGTALLTLDRPTESVALLRQAQALAPTLLHVRERLAAAEDLAQSQARRQVAAAPARRDSASSPAANLLPGAGRERVAAQPTRVYSNEAQDGRTQ
jgi:tetratricopeptide (TPR) repeat protein